MCPRQNGQFYISPLGYYIEQYRSAYSVQWDDKSVHTQLVTSDIIGFEIAVNDFTAGPVY